ncbi:DNA polymerase/3'-5' exonuclease PolX [Vulgatibacter incomptus]|uniref:DNA polymerase beta n=1 Tax=Vulgatibacter incomptus TaxID=1391653 RepID=A0A0K1PA16_9BACT|nr:DNA polymerase/3'-5' exonuclease PolX [Vulgatibacter incomptus]AKU90256.1 DNA polymerase X family [Vulgatibacter incomptus]
MENADVAQVLYDMGAMTEVIGGNPFKVRAFRQAAEVIDTLPGPVSELWRKDELTGLPSVGTRIADKIGEILESGTCEEYEELAAEVPMGVLELLRIEGVGPKTVASVWKELGVTDLDGLEDAIDSGRLKEVPRMGPVRVRAIRKAIGRYRARGGRMPLHRALYYAEGILGRLRRVPGVIRAEAAGSLRRRRETVGDLDLLIASERPGPVMRAFASLPDVDEVIARGDTKSSVRLEIGLHVDLRVLPPESFGAALHYFTGSKNHNIAIRTRAVRLGLKLSEYGVFDREGNRLSGEREEDVFEAVGLPWIPPELREGTGELEAAEAGKLPHLVTEEDLLGDLHVHSDTSSDGRSSLQDLWREAKGLGRQYLAITDHSRSRPLGLEPKALLAHAKEIRAASKKFQGGPKLLAGVEVDILPDGSLDLPADVLGSLDWVVASIHTHFDDPPDRITARMVKAIESGVVDAIGHPSGRLIGKRDPYSYDLEAVLDAARAHGVALELNAMPDRLDLTDGGCRLAKEAGVPVVIDSDAHVSSHLSLLRFGVWVARRGWLEKEDIVNTRPASRLRETRRGEAAREERK